MSRHLEHKKRVYHELYKWTKTGTTDIYAKDCLWRGSHPLNEKEGLEALMQEVWRPLFLSFPDIERRDYIVMGGESFGNDFVACMGCYVGTFTKPWLTIPPTGKSITVNYGEVHKMGASGSIVESWCLWDILDVIRQSGFWPLAPMLGREALWLPPISGDGLLLQNTDSEQSMTSLVRTLSMHQALSDKVDTEENMTTERFVSGKQKNYWHDNMMWYGPCGIGTTRGLQGFVKEHQLPFRKAFPDRKGGKQWDEVPEKKAQYGGGHYINLGDGSYSVTGGWPSVLAQHKGSGFMGLPPTGKEVTMRVMDFYLHHEDKIRENWVPLDVLDLLKQIGIDVFERLQYDFTRGGTS